MRIERCVTSVSWIPRESIVGLMRTAFDVGVAHYDAPPPDRLLSLEDMRQQGMFRFANQLRAWIEVDRGRIVDHGQTGQGYVSDTELKLGPTGVTFGGVKHPELRSQERPDDRSVRFVQTIGGRTGVPFPHIPHGLPYLSVVPPTVWTTLSLTLHADGLYEYDLLGASPFPRHWVYDDAGALRRKVAVADFDTWVASVFGDRTPWGGHNLAAVVVGVESSLEHQLSAGIMDAPRRPVIRRLRRGARLVRQNEPGTELFLLLNGLLAVEVNGEVVVQIGPGAIVGERAVLGEGRRTASLIAVTPVTVAITQAENYDLETLRQLEADRLKPPPL